MSSLLLRVIYKKYATLHIQESSIDTKTKTCSPTDLTIICALNLKKVN